jgi:hypothetical protein
MRTGIKTTEFWVGLIGAVLLVIQQQLFPEHPFPAEAFYAFGIWIGARFAEKAFTNGKGVLKRAWKTSEFWVTLAVSTAKYLFPDLSPEIVNFVYMYILGRPALKVGKSLKE